MAPIKKHTLWICILLAALVFLVLEKGTLDNCTNVIAGTPLDVVVTAFEAEQLAIFERVERERSCMVGDTTYHVVRYEGEVFITYMSGMGPVAARATTEQTLSSFNVSLLVFSGIAGARDPHLALGDTVVARTWVDLETGASTTVSSTLVQKAASQPVVLVEQGVSSDHFVTDTSVLPEQASIVDMETYDMATVAQLHHVPFIAFRSVSDFADGRLSDNGFTLAASNSADVALHFVAQN